MYLAPSSGSRAANKFKLTEREPNGEAWQAHKKNDYPQPPTRNHPRDVGGLAVSAPAPAQFSA